MTGQLGMSDVILPWEVQTSDRQAEVFWLVGNIAR